jgi:hypothetical protein
MRKLTAVLALAVLVTAQAQAHGFRGDFRGYAPSYRYVPMPSNTNWLAPALAGAAIGYAMAQPYRAYSQPGIVYSQPQCQPIYQSITILDQQGQPQQALQQVGCQ